MVERGKPINPLERQEEIGVVDGNAPAEEPVAEGRHGFGTERKSEDVGDAPPGNDHDADAPQ